MLIFINSRGSISVAEVLHLIRSYHPHEAGPPCLPG